MAKKLNGKSFFYKVILTLMITITVFLSGTVISYASDNLECQYLSGVNTNMNNYDRWTSTVKSYLTTAKKDGKEVYMRVQAGVRDGGVYIVYYDKDFKLLRHRRSSR